MTHLSPKEASRLVKNAKAEARKRILREKDSNLGKVEYLFMENTKSFNCADYWHVGECFCPETVDNGKCARCGGVKQ